MRATVEHPSNRLYRGEIRDFVEATFAVEEQLEHEINLSRQMDQEYGPLPHPELDGDMRAYADRAAKARQVYMVIKAEAEQRAIVQLREAGLTEFADALESGDYSRLAI